jgi:hypothetical protein
VSRHDSHNNAVEVKVGQIYEDRDPRRLRRRVQVERIEPSTAANVSSLAWVRSLDTGRHSFIATSHLRPIGNLKGWTLVSESLLPNTEEPTA